MAEKENQAAKPRFKLTNSGGVMPVFDSLSNVVTGMGTNRDRRSYIGMSNASGSVRLHLSDGGINLNVGSQTLSLSSDGLTHNGKNIGSTHKHGGVEPGGSKTDGPE
jgi:hypothetical protein